MLLYSTSIITIKATGAPVIKETKDKELRTQGSQLDTKQIHYMH
jgi:hypothetical protein